MTFVERIIAYMELNGYQIFRGPDELNIVYVEGCNEDGSLNADEWDGWNDRRLVFMWGVGLTVFTRPIRIIRRWYRCQAHRFWGIGT